MITPSALLERPLAAYGDRLSHVALLAGGDERAAATLLLRATRELLDTWQEQPPAHLPAETEVLASLVATARGAEPRTPRRAPRLVLSPFALHHLPLDRRLALGLHLLLGYDCARIGQTLALDEVVARTTLIAAVRALGPAAGTSLPDRVEDELCEAVRAALVDPPAGARHGPVARGHLAACALCRSFDRAWGEITRQVETALRAAFRERPLPAALRERLLARARPPRHVGPGLRQALPPLAVLALIAALVLPGFLREPARVVERQEIAPVDADALVARAIERYGQPPDRGEVWYRRYETLWYFDDVTIAPLRAEMWLDPRNPARHRLQLTHVDGGAPYELQLGDGASRLYYALDGLFAPALYGPLPTPARPGAPALLVEDLNADAQQRALALRLASGPWALPLNYLRQARSAASLRALGRQRDGAGSVQILSFTGVSPLGLPSDAPGTGAERVTVLLAIDPENGLLRSATELAGPQGAAQTSRLTWRLIEERATTPQEQVFAINRAWTGVGDFNEVGRHRSADLALPLIHRQALGEPARLLAPPHNQTPVWTPAAPPAGVERALLLWGDGNWRRRAAPRALVYLGEGRQLMLLFNTDATVEGEEMIIGPWRAILRAGRTQRYTLALHPSQANGGDTDGDPGGSLLLDARGFTRNEVLALAADLRPFDARTLAAHRPLFAAVSAYLPQS
ncbi:MAG: anti-sigma factor [Chloroflexaceae bacterium]|nr:anti-sigma factor [Chloroflexaceae bacterium]